MLRLADGQADSRLAGCWHACEQRAQLFKGVRLELGEVRIHVERRMGVKMLIIPEKLFAAL